MPKINNKAVGRYEKSEESSDFISRSNATSRYAKARAEDGSIVSIKSLKRYIVTLGGYGLDYLFIPPFLVKEAFYVFKNESEISLRPESLRLTKQNLKKLLRNFYIPNYIFISIAIGKIYLNSYVMPVFNESIKGVERAFDKVNEIESDDEFYSQFYSALKEFAINLFILGMNYNLFLSSISWLQHRIKVSHTRDFIDKIFYFHSYYGINLVGNNFNISQLIRDQENASNAIFLFFERLNNLSLCYLSIQKLYEISAVFITFNLLFASIEVPFIVTACISYTLILNIIISILEYPIELLTRSFKDLSDSFFRKVEHLKANAEALAFSQSDLMERDAIHKNYADMVMKEKISKIFESIKDWINFMIAQMAFIVPYLTTIKDIRAGALKKEDLWPCIGYFYRISDFLTWAKDKFAAIKESRTSIDRIKEFDEGYNQWIAIVKKNEEAFADKDDKLAFSGKIYQDDSETPEALVAQGSLSLRVGDVYHLSAASGKGKTIIFRTFRRIWPYFDGKGEIAKSKTYFSPSSVYIPDKDEPLLQAILHPKKVCEASDEEIGMIRQWMNQLNLTEVMIESLEKVDPIGWDMKLSDGQGKRIGFLNVLHKMKYSDNINYFLDEPFKGVDEETIEDMIGLFKKYLNKDKHCVIFTTHSSSHHNLATHTITFGGEEKRFEVSRKSFIAI